MDLDTCFSPEFGITEDEQFLYNAEIGILQLELDTAITLTHVGYSIEPGFNIVFVYRHFLENSFNIDDDEVEVRFLFEVDGDSDSFIIDSQAEFEDSKSLYAGCGFVLQQINGRIEGEKISEGHWDIDAALFIERVNNTIELDFNGTFKF
jgi:hypothetical protein